VQLQLRCIAGPERHKRWKFDFPPYTTIVIGRIQGCHLVLKDTKISQSHCLIQVHEGNLCAVDLGSTYGTWLNDSAITGLTKLTSDDHLRIGKSTFIIEIVAKS